LLGARPVRQEVRGAPRLLLWVAVASAGYRFGDVGVVGGRRRRAIAWPRLRSRARCRPRRRSWSEAATMSRPTPLSNAAAPGQDRPCGYGQAELIHHCRGDRGNRRKQGRDCGVRDPQFAYVRPGPASLLGGRILLGESRRDDGTPPVGDQVSNAGNKYSSPKSRQLGSDQSAESRATIDIDWKREHEWQRFRNRIP
jgi:hypothetical protein